MAVFNLFALALATLFCLWTAYQGAIIPKKRQDRMLFISVGVGFAYGFGYQLWADSYHYYRMGQKTATATGKLIDYYRSGKRAYSVAYRFPVADTMYTGDCKDAEGRYDQCADTKSCLGTQVLVRYAVTDPSENELVLLDTE